MRIDIRVGNGLYKVVGAVREVPPLCGVHIRVRNLRTHVPVKVVVASSEVPRHLQRWLRVNTTVVNLNIETVLSEAILLENRVELGIINVTHSSLVEVIANANHEGGINIRCDLR